MRRQSTFGVWVIRAVLVVGVLALCGAWPNDPASAQDLDCASLKARIDAGRDPRGAPDTSSALQNQQFELDRLRTYSDSIGCGSGFFFGAPPQCDSIERRMSRLQDSIEELQQRVQDGSGEGGWRRRALIEQYNANCGRGGDQPSDPAYDGAGGQGDPDASMQATPDEGASPGGPVHSKALCVRHCDGGFFPITEQASAGNLDRLDQICKALCPNAEASLYTVAPDGGLENAVAPDGASYTALPAAFRFQKTYDPTCSCKPANKSWAEALADAETLLEKNKGDVVVTKRMSDAMSRPVQPNQPESAAAPAASKPAKIGKAARNRKSPNSVAATRPAAPAPLPNDLGQPPPAPGDPDGGALTRQFRRSEPTL